MPEQQAELARIAADVPVDVWERLRRRAERNNRTMAGELRQIVLAALDDKAESA